MKKTKDGLNAIHIAAASPVDHGDELLKFLFEECDFVRLVNTKAGHVKPSANPKVEELRNRLGDPRSPTAQELVHEGCRKGADQ